MITGSCLCSGVAFAIDGRLTPMQLCHARRCRKFTGSAFSPELAARTSQFRWLRGEELISAESQARFQGYGPPSPLPTFPGVYGMPGAGAWNFPRVAPPGFAPGAEEGFTLGGEERNEGENGADLLEQGWAADLAEGVEEGSDGGDRASAEYGGQGNVGE